MLCFYAGNLLPGQAAGEDDEAMGYQGMNALFSTADYCGLSTFFNHAPSALKFPDPAIFSRLLNAMGQQVSETDLRLNDELYSVEFANDKIT